MRHPSLISAVRLALVAALLWACGAHAAGENDLYRAQTIVTGQGEANRHIGFASCLEDVLIKASGLLRLAGDPRLDKYKADAASLVRDYTYRDEKGGKPKNDEQGTRDRSFILTADFDEAGRQQRSSIARRQNPGFRIARCSACWSRWNWAQNASLSQAIQAKPTCTGRRCLRRRQSGECPL
jgi:hypothetical protein